MNYKSSHTGEQIDSAVSSIIDLYAASSSDIGKALCWGENGFELEDLSTPSNVIPLIVDMPDIGSESFGSVTFSEIESAYNNNRPIWGDREGTRYIFYRFDGNTLPSKAFFYTYSSSDTINIRTKHKDGHWTGSTITFATSSQLSDKQDKSNLTTTLTSSVTDTQYPSAKCVYDELQIYTTILDNKITTPSSASSGDFLCWNGSAWTATTLSTLAGGNY